MTPLLLIFLFGALFIILECVFPGRGLPKSRGWYLRAVFLNGVQLGVVLLGGITWSIWLKGPSLFHMDGILPDIAQGFVCWFVGSFFFYWWHRARHSVNFFWREIKRARLDIKNSHSFRFGRSQASSSELLCFFIQVEGVYP